MVSHNSKFWIAAWPQAPLQRTASSIPPFYGSGSLAYPSDWHSSAVSREAYNISEYSQVSKCHISKSSGYVMDQVDKRLYRRFVPSLLVELDLPGVYDSAYWGDFLSLSGCVIGQHEKIFRWQGFTIQARQTSMYIHSSVRSQNRMFVWSFSQVLNWYTHLFGRKIPIYMCEIQSLDTCINQSYKALWTSSISEQVIKPCFHIIHNKSNLWKRMGIRYGQKPSLSDNFCVSRRDTVRMLRGVVMGKQSTWVVYACVGYNCKSLGETFYNIATADALQT